jgi:hypothetical protein
LDAKVIIVLVLTFIIYFVGTLSFSTRTAGIKTGKIAISASIFNIFSLGSRAATSLQVPLLAKTVETNIRKGTTGGLLMIFRYVLISAALGSICGALFMPTFQRIFCKSIDSFNIHRSVPRLILHGFSKSGITQFRRSIKMPSRQSIKQLKSLEGMPKKIILFNVIATALLTTSSISCTYAQILNPEFRTTCSSLSPVINAIPTLLLTIFIDPNLSMMTDDVILGKRTEGDFNRCVKFMVSSRILGTIVAQVILIPAAVLVAWVASIL